MFFSSLGLGLHQVLDRNDRPSTVNDLLSSPVAFCRSPKWVYEFNIAKLATVWCFWGYQIKIFFEDEKWDLSAV